MIISFDWPLYEKKSLPTMTTVATRCIRHMGTHTRVGYLTLLCKHFGISSQTFTSLSIYVIFFKFYKGGEIQLKRKYLRFHLIFVDNVAVLSMNICDEGVLEREMKCCLRVAMILKLKVKYIYIGFFCCLLEFSLSV